MLPGRGGDLETAPPRGRWNRRRHNQIGELRAVDADCHPHAATRRLIRPFADDPRPDMEDATSAARFQPRRTPFAADPHLHALPGDVVDLVCLGGVGQEGPQAWTVEIPWLQ